MKKTFFALAFATALLFAQNVFASSSPSLDGRAIVAEAGTFPRGYFAKTVGYLPGDSISVTNPMNGKQVSILVIGSLDASEGVAILLSPESAEALAIKKDSNNIVKLTKRNGTADKVANGTAVITNAVREGEDDEDLKDEIAEAEEIAEEIEVAAAEEEFEETEIAAAEEELDEIPEEAEIAVAEEEFDEIPEETEVAVAEEEELEEIPEEAEVALAEEEEFDEIPEESEVALEEEEEEVFDEIREEKVELAEGFLEEDEEEFDEVVYERVDDYYIPEESEEVAKASESFEDIPEEEESEDDTEDVFIAESEAVEDEYDAIVLVPAEANPPESDEDDFDTEDAVIAKSESAPAEEPSTSLSDKDDARYLKSAAELESQKYYVQIAVYSQNENVEQLDALYGDRYPLTILDEGARKTVLVGPLGMDEYGTVLERFRLFGFRDAFVRHVN